MDREAARAHVEAWERAWRHYQVELPRLPGSATLYKDAGMEKTMRKVSRALAPL